MNRIFLFFSILLVGSLLGNRCVARAQSDSFPNGSFETNPAGGANDWTALPYGWTWDNSIASSGVYSARVSRSSGNQSGSLYSAYIAVQPSIVYSLYYWLSTQNANFYPRVLIYQYNSLNQLMGPYLIAYSNIANGTSDWKETKYRFQTMQGVSKIRIMIYLDTDTIGTFWFDSFRLDMEGMAVFPIEIGFPINATGPVMLSSPTVFDINNDGDKEILIGASNAVNGWDKKGKPLPGFPLVTGDRQIVGQIALADIDEDGRTEIAAGTRAAVPGGQCRVFIWHDDGTLLNGWPQKVDWNTQYSHNDCWITSVLLADIAGDDHLEVVAGTTNNGAGNPYLNLSTPNLYAWNIDGSLVAGDWPNQQTTAGVYGALAAGDINKDGKADVLVGRDYIYFNVYGSNGQSLPGWPIRTFVNRNNGDYDIEQRIGYSVNAPILADLDNDGNREIIVAGHVSGPGNPTPELILNNAVLVLEPDGTRRTGWETAALGSGVLAQSDLPWQAPATADLDNDGKLEIVVATEDGWIRAYREDKTLLWAFNYTQGAVTFGTEPVIGDIDGDDSSEIVFGTYVASLSGNDKDGPVGLWALKPDGSLITGFPLVIPTPGMRSAPTLADIDGDENLEILAATRNGQVFAWHTETKYNFLHMPWPTGRHDLRRSATYPSLNPLEASYKSSSQRLAADNDIVSFTIHIFNSGTVNETLTLTDRIPAGLEFVPGSLKAPSGFAEERDGLIQWNSTLPGLSDIDISYDVQVTTPISKIIHTKALINSVTYGSFTLSVDLFVNSLPVYLPICVR